MKRKRILLTGGGTGGHLAIVRAVKEELLRLGASPYYIGSESGQDRAWFGEDETFAKRLFLKSRGVVDKRGFAKTASMVQLLRSAYIAHRFMRDQRIEAVLSVGGFSAAPASFAAVAARTPLFIHEQNAVSGRLNTILKPFAKAYFSSYFDDYVDYPVSDIFFESARVRKEVRRVIFLGGSQGARAINDFALSVASALHEQKIDIIHQCGGSDYARVKLLYERLGIEADLFPFSDRIHEKVAEADFAVCRAGAGTVWELAANRLPALFVPYPYAAGDHQYKNAMFLVKRGAGWVAREDELKSELFFEILKEGVEEASAALASVISKGGAGEIAEALIGKRKKVLPNGT